MQPPVRMPCGPCSFPPVAGTKAPDADWRSVSGHHPLRSFCPTLPPLSSKLPFDSRRCLSGKARRDEECPDVGLSKGRTLRLPVGIARDDNKRRPRCGASRRYARSGDKPTDNSAPPSDRKEHTSELQSRQYLVCRLLLEKK